MDWGTEITLWLESGVAVASSQLSGRRELPLGAQEVVISSDTSGKWHRSDVSPALEVLKPCSDLEQERTGRE